MIRRGRCITGSDTSHQAALGRCQSLPGRCSRKVPESSRNGRCQSLPGESSRNGRCQSLPGTELGRCQGLPGEAVPESSRNGAGVVPESSRRVVPESSRRGRWRVFQERGVPESSRNGAGVVPESSRRGGARVFQESLPGEEGEGERSWGGARVFQEESSRNGAHAGLPAPPGLRSSRSFLGRPLPGKLRCAGEFPPNLLPPPGVFPALCALWGEEENRLTASGCAGSC
jgi:hypothetical protein